MVDNRSYESVARAVNALLETAIVVPSDPPPGMHTIDEGEWVRGLVERAQLVVLPHASGCDSMRRMQMQLETIHSMCQSDLARARRLMAALTWTLPLQN